MDVELKEKALCVRNFAIIFVGPIVTHAVLRGTNAVVSISLVSGWLFILLFSHFAYQRLKCGTSSARITRLFENYRVPKILLTMKLHKLWVGRR